MPVEGGGTPGGGGPGAGGGAGVGAVSSPPLFLGPRSRTIRPVETPFFTLDFRLPGTAYRREGVVKLLQRYDSVGGLEVNDGSTIALDFNAEDRRDSDYYDARISGTPSRITIARGGTYRVTYSVAVENQSASGNSNLAAWVRKNGSGSGLPGSFSYARTQAPNRLRSAASAAFVEDVVAADYIEVLVARTGTATASTFTIANESSVLVELLGDDSATRLGGTRRMYENGQLDSVTITRGRTGTSGSCLVDILRNGVSVLPSAKFSLPAASSFVRYTIQDYGIVFGVPDDIWEVDVTSNDSPPTLDLGVVLEFSRAG